MRHANAKSQVALALATAALAAMGVAGCANNTPQNPPDKTTVVTSPPPTPPPSPTTATSTTVSNANTPGTNNVNAGPGGATGTDSAVADAVNKAIHTNVQLTGSRITAVVDASGVATLTGTAQNQQQKALAAKAASDTSGVTSVKNKIEIAPTGGAKAKTAATKVIHETKVIVVPGSSPAGNGASQANGNPSAGSSSSNGGGADTSAENTTSSSGSAPASGNGQ